MGITYDVTNNIITVTGYSEASPCTFNDLWTADKAGTLSLHARTGIAAVDGSPVNLTRNARPADRVVLGGAKQDLYVVVTAWTNMTAATVRLIGTDTSDAVQTEDLAITGNGTYYPTKYFKTLTQTQVTVFTKSDSGSFAYEVKQGQWGVVWKQAGNQFALDCRIDVADDSTVTWFADAGKAVTFNPGCLSADYQSCIGLRNYSHFRLGEVIDAAKKLSRKGCFIASFATNNERMIGTWGRDKVDAQLLNSIFARLSAGYSFVNFLDASGWAGQSYVCKVWHSIFCVTTPYLSNADWFDVISSDNPYYCFSQDRGTFSNVKAFNTPIALQGSSPSVPLVTFTNPWVRNCSTALLNISAGNTYLINVDTDTWLMQWWGTGTVYRQYTIDLKVSDKENNAIAGATVSLLDKDGNTVFSVTTVADGTIAQQTVSRGYYDQAHGSSLQDYGPHMLIVSKPGYQTYRKKLVIGAPIVWEVKLVKANSVFFSSGKPIVNLKPTDPENKELLVL